ncbi:LamG-like jellyroll fold domain-containing protein [Paenibacillus sp. 1P07SE]|uniref:LamG-like jellyroll fold domain-containing protein n=1 Tax=Paenibacillus sp. 1P07SE TaxID=3132209 RepID=UPI0039A40126
MTVYTMTDLLCFWDFQEPPSVSKRANGPFAYELIEQNGPIERVKDGVFGPYSAAIKEGQWLSIPRHLCPELDIQGRQAAVTVVAWVKWDSDRRCQALAGMWDETRKQRQYCLFFNLTGRYESERNIHGHVSAVGGPTPGERYCVTYATGSERVPFGKWTMVAMTYDGAYSRVYYNGRLDYNPPYNPYPYDQGLFEADSDGADFTVASVSANGMMKNFFSGQLGGLAIFKRALSDDEMRELYTTTLSGDFSKST